jgi:WD40 repeat protein
MIQVWDASTGGVLCTLKGHTGNVAQVSWSPDGKRLASCSWEDRTVKLWDRATGEAVISFPFLIRGKWWDCPACVEWSSDGSRLAVGCADSGALRIFDATKGYRLAGRPGAGKQE